jgi:hypothetical protein
MTMMSHIPVIGLKIAFFCKNVYGHGEPYMDKFIERKSADH